MIILRPLRETSFKPTTLYHLTRKENKLFYMNATKGIIGGRRDPKTSPVERVYFTPDPKYFGAGLETGAIAPSNQLVVFICKPKKALRLFDPFNSNKMEKFILSIIRLQASGKYTGFEGESIQKIIKYAQGANNWGSFYERGETAAIIKQLKFDGWLEKGWQTKNIALFNPNDVVSINKIIPWKEFFNQINGLSSNNWQNFIHCEWDLDQKYAVLDAAFKNGITKSAIAQAVKAAKQYFPDAPESELVKYITNWANDIYP